MIRYFALFFLLFISTVFRGQNNGINERSYAFGQIFTGFRYGLNSNLEPRAAFDFNQGIIGYYHQLNEKISGKIMYDVTRTTHLYGIYDTSGNSLSYSYFEGSKYTAYLKMAEIRWDLSEILTFRVGQLLSNQYLTFQDKFWGYRYIDVTFQEKFRLGMPADFGFQVDVKMKDKFLNQFSVVNGEGPFRYQDGGGKFLFSNTIRYTPVKNLTARLYTDIAQKPDTGSHLDNKYVIAGFLGYKCDKFMAGGEYLYISNWQYSHEQSVDGFSIFGSLNIYPKISLLGRYDYVYFNLSGSTSNVNYYIAGIHYEPYQKFYISTNFRYYSPDELPMVYANFGLFL
ncbi:MAG: hypothetical protein JXA03_03640 [Bacteroidales bacterium]|nr:hypothetical protein [Bacteroidales bacterium]